MASAIGSFSNPESLPLETFTKILDSADSDDRFSNWLALKTASAKMWKYTQGENISKWVWDHLYSSRNRIKAYLLCDAHKIFQREIPSVDAAWTYKCNSAENYPLIGPGKLYQGIHSKFNKIVLKMGHNEHDYFYKSFSVCKTPEIVGSFLLTKDNKAITAFTSGKVEIIDLITQSKIKLFGHKDQVEDLIIDSAILYSVSDDFIDLLDSANEPKSKRTICVWDLTNNKKLAESEMSFWSIPEIEVDKVGMIFDLNYKRAFVYKSIAIPK